MPEDAELTFKKLRVCWNKCYHKKYEWFLKAFLLFALHLIHYYFTLSSLLDFELHGYRRKKILK